MDSLNSAASQKCGKDPSSTVKIQMILPMINVVRKRDIEGKKIK